MKRFYFYLLSALCAVLTGCSSFSSKLDKPEPNVTGMVHANADGRRIRKAMQRQSRSTYKKDQVSFTAFLYLPEIENPRAAERSEEIQLVDAPESGPSVQAGNICISAVVISASKADLSNENWSAEIQVNGSAAKSQFKMKTMNSYDDKVHCSQPVPGHYTLRVCTEAAFPQVEKVTLTLRDSAGKKLTALDWEKPWPPLHEP